MSDLKVTFENATSVSLCSVTSNFSIDWGDGTNIEEYTNQNPFEDSITHTYAIQGTYTATITGTITSLNKIPYDEGYYIKEIIIPSTVESIESNVLDYTSISIITFESSTPVEGFYIGDNLIPDDDTIIIRVPTGSLSAYQNSGISNGDLYPISYVEYSPQSSNNSSTPTPISNLYNHLKQLHKYWFYDKDEIDTNLSTAIRTSESTGLVTNTGSIDNTTYLTASDISGLANTSDIKQVGFTGSYGDLTGVPSTFTPSSHNHTVTELSDNTAHTNLGTSANDSQGTINTAIDSRISALSDLELIEVTNDKGTASASTMNKLYLVPESSSATNDQYEIFVTVRTGTSPNYTYAWEKLDTTRIDLSGLASDTHTHGNISRDGKIGTDSDKIITTSTNGLAVASTTIGNIDYDGAIGSDSGKVAVTTTDGVVTVSDWYVELDSLVGDLLAYGAPVSGSTVTINFVVGDEGFRAKSGVGHGLGCFLCDPNGTYGNYQSVSGNYEGSCQYSPSLNNNILYSDLIECTGFNDYLGLAEFNANQELSFSIDNVIDGTYYIIFADYDDNNLPIFGDSYENYTDNISSVSYSDAEENAIFYNYKLPGNDDLGEGTVLTITVDSDSDNVWYSVGSYYSGS